MFAELDHLKQQTDIEREAELITFDLEDNTGMSYCMYIVWLLNSHILQQIAENFDEILAKIEANE